MCLSDLFFTLAGKDPEQEQENFKANLQQDHK